MNCLRKALLVSSHSGTHNHEEHATWLRRAAVSVVRNSCFAIILYMYNIVSLLNKSYRYSYYYVTNYQYNTYIADSEIFKNVSQIQAIGL